MAISPEQQRAGVCSLQQCCVVVYCAVSSPHPTPSSRPAATLVKLHRRNYLVIINNNKNISCLEGKARSKGSRSFRMLVPPLCVSGRGPMAHSSTQGNLEIPAAQALMRKAQWALTGHQAAQPPLGPWFQVWVIQGEALRPSPSPFTTCPAPRDTGARQLQGSRNPC